jgi:hypothetical protein
MFSFRALGWSDVDLPISYSFGFDLNSIDINQDYNDDLIIFRSRSELSSTSSMLPSSPIESNNNNIMLCLHVYDNINALSSSYKLINVQISSYLNEQDLELKVSSAIESSIGNIDALLQVISITSTILNSVNCSLAANNCENMFNRHKCSKKSHTCGECIDGYIGDNGDANSKCISLVEYNLIFNQTNINQTYISITNFNSRNYQRKAENPRLNDNIVARNLQYVPMSCPGDNCLGRGLNNVFINLFNFYFIKKIKYFLFYLGKCKYIEIDSGLIINSCDINSIYCKAICICDDNFYGTVCSFNSSSYQSIVKTRELLLVALQGNINMEGDPTGDIIVSWMNSLKSICNSNDELDTDISILSISILKDILSYAIIKELSAELINNNAVFVINTLIKVLLSRSVEDRAIRLTGMTFLNDVIKLLCTYFTSGSLSTNIYI